MTWQIEAKRLGWFNSSFSVTADNNYVWFDRYEISESALKNIKVVFVFLICVRCAIEEFLSLILWNQVHFVWAILWMKIDLCAECGSWWWWIWFNDFREMQIYDWNYVLNYIKYSVSLNANCALLINSISATTSILIVCVGMWAILANITIS